MFPSPFVVDLHRAEEVSLRLTQEHLETSLGALAGFNEAPRQLDDIL